MKNSIRLGILGGGQLARMLVQNNPYHDLEVHALAENTECLENLNVKIHNGQLNQLSDLEEFIKEVHFITFENEFLNTDLLEELLEKYPKKIFFPHLNTLKITQNKLFQKFLFQKLNLLSLNFEVYNSSQETLPAWLEKCFKKFGKCVLKRAQGGYDGKGNFLFKDHPSIHQAFEFCAKAIKENSEIYCEEFAHFEKEVAMVYAQSLKQEFKHYPLVISEQKNHICDLVYGPATEFGISTKLEKQAIEIGKKIALELKYAGVFALEFFVVNNEVIINEMAPRVHNSAHYTLEACLNNQFNTHIRAGLGGDLGNLTTFPFFAMQNLIGTQNISAISEPKLPFEAPFNLHWYGKKDSRIGRKLGHLNTVGTSQDDLLNKIRKMKDFIKTLNF